MKKQERGSFTGGIGFVLAAAGSAAAESAKGIFSAAFRKKSDFGADDLHHSLELPAGLRSLCEAVPEGGAALNQSNRSAAFESLV